MPFQEGATIPLASVESRPIAASVASRPIARVQSYKKIKSTNFSVFFVFPI
jgi:hypothetical protein